MKHSKRIVIVLVEGRSDREALQNIISALFDECYNGLFTVEFIEEKEDITSKKGIIPRCIEEWISKTYIVPYLSRNYLSTDDVQQIIQLTDLDGTYIDDSLIIENPSLQDVQYGLNEILAKSKKDIVKRNANKKKNLDYLVNCEKFKLGSPDGRVLKEIPYRVFYFSSNLDHFLYGVANLDSVKKVSNAIAFAQKTSSTDFETMVMDDGLLADYVARNQSYQESWEYIRQSTNSLGRFSNINILINDILNGYFVD